MPARSVALAVFVLLLQAGAASATKGVAVDLGLIEIDEPLQPGGTYRLPKLGVRNPGDEASTYVMRIGQTGRADATELEAGWFTFSPAEFRLEADARTFVTISLHLPADVRPGRYEGLLSASLASDGEGALVGAAAAARLTFEVAESTSVEALLRELTSFLNGSAPWSYLVLGLVPVAILLRWTSRRFHIRLERRA